MHFFGKNISIYAILNNQSFNDMLTNDIISFKQLNPDILHTKVSHKVAYAKSAGPDQTAPL